MEEGTVWLHFVWLRGESQKRKDGERNRAESERSFYIVWYEREYGQKETVLNLKNK